MSKRRMITVDGNEAVASVAHRTNEVIAIYPITPSSNMGEWADEWSAKGKPNVWGTVPLVQEMQSEAGAAGAAHGALQAGALTTTFTASQGLLLMIPNMYKIAGELTPFCMHVAARTVATHALSIFGDHSDVMACRQTGFAMLAVGVGAGGARLRGHRPARDAPEPHPVPPLLRRVPHVARGGEDRAARRRPLRAMVPEDLIAAHRERALTPDRPVIRGTAQNPDAFFQAREAVNGLYDGCAATVQASMDAFAALTGRRYRLFEYVGHPEAERVVVIMGSGGEVAHEAVEHLVAKGERVGVLKVRLFRPFDVARLMEALPRAVTRIAVLDRTKEPGAIGEPLYQDVVTALRECGAWRGERSRPRHRDRRPVRPLLQGLHAGDGEGGPRRAEPARRRRAASPSASATTSRSSRSPTDPTFDTEPADVVRAVFYGLGADGTVGANKNSIKIIGEDTPLFAQGYFVYDSKKSGSMTVSHLRFGPGRSGPPTSSSEHPSSPATSSSSWSGSTCSSTAAPGAVFLLNAPYPADEVWDRLPREVQEQRSRQAASGSSSSTPSRSRATQGWAARINTMMQTCFFAISGVLPREEAIAAIKKAIEKTLRRKRGAEVVEKQLATPSTTRSRTCTRWRCQGGSRRKLRPPTVSPAAPDFVRSVTAPMLAGKGDLLPVSAFPVDGTWPTGTARWEKRAIAQEIPAWDAATCIQCNKCSLVCPHAAIRAKRYPVAALAGAPAGFASVALRGGAEGERYTLQVAAEDCTGCTLCVEACPETKDGEPAAQGDRHARRTRRCARRSARSSSSSSGSARRGPRARCGSTSRASQFLRAAVRVLRRLRRLRRDAVPQAAHAALRRPGADRQRHRLLVDLRRQPADHARTRRTRDGRGPAWANSLFEDNAEFGLGMRLARRQARRARRASCCAQSAPDGRRAPRGRAPRRADQSTEAGIGAQRERVAVAATPARGQRAPEARRLAALADHLVRRASGSWAATAGPTTSATAGSITCSRKRRDVNVLVLDTEVYSNTGGQASKATPLGAAAKFATNGKATAKKDLALLAMTYGTAYVARVALGAKDAQTVAAFREAESFPGTSILIAYSHCIAHGYELEHGLSQQRAAVESGYWPLLRYDPRRAAKGESPLKLDSSAPSLPLAEFSGKENRFKQVGQADPAAHARFAEEAQRAIHDRWAHYQRLAQP